MFETCSKRFMLFGTVCLGVLTIFILILESHLADSISGNQRMKNKTFPTENNSTCWQTQQYEIIRECHPCSDFEIRSKSIGVCIHTSFKEILKCKNGETVTRSCDRVAYLEERAFWKFTIWTFVIGTVSSVAVMLRTRVLNHKARMRARQVLSNGTI
ncbi:jumping translocation breakpoint protein (JTB) domain-containing protein [Phthorimaea operculella]|nr:jumping translocation breakpoint protein (JTB) domain-containing protein [Phthorimaea operculella]